MEAIMVKPEALVLVLVLVVESLKALLLGMFTALKRGKMGKFINKEDAEWLGGEVVSLDAPEPSRFFRAQRNALENLLPFSVLACCFILIGGNGLAATVYFTAFSLSRLAHCYAYLTCKPMMRRNAYSIGWLVQILLALHVATIVILGHLTVI
ncbi:glutathione S-transferase [Alteromonadaceae bacterium 2753L.S.0a.02]|nr:glutathione S-transferase [Alteromonadaceae bacterium 2753L.S.0a.02]